MVNKRSMTRYSVQGFYSIGKAFLEGSRTPLVHPTNPLRLVFGPLEKVCRYLGMDFGPSKFMLNLVKID